MSNKPRIAIIGDFPIGKIYNKFPDRTSGYPTWLYNLHLGFEHCDSFEIHWIIADKQIKEEETYYSRNQTFHLMPATRLTVGLYSAYIYNRFKIAKCLKRIKPDLVHAWGTERFYALAANDFKGKTLLSIQGLLIAYSQRAPISGFEHKQKLYEKGSVRKADYLTTESPWAADRVRELAPHATIFPWEYAAEKEFFSIKRELDPEPSCLLIGNNTPVKNINLAIRAFSSPALQHVRLYMAGIPTDAYTSLPSNIIPLGKLNRTELISYMSKAWCLVHTSLADTGPTVVKEARVAGLPVVLTSDCGSKQHVDEGKSGYIIQPNDTEALINAVLQITQSQATSIKMGAHQRKTCQKALSTDTMLTKIQEIYKQILAF